MDTFKIGEVKKKNKTKQSKQNKIKKIQTPQTEMKQTTNKQTTVTHAKHHNQTINYLINEVDWKSNMELK
jgi:hypothetical protein